MDHLAARHPDLDTLGLGEPGLNEVLPAKLSAFPSLTCLRLRDLDLRGNRIDALCSLSKLEYIQLARCRVDAGAIRRLHRLEKLKTLGFNDVHFDRESCSGIGSLPTLGHVHLQDCKGIDALLAELANALVLHSIDLFGTDADDAGFGPFLNIGRTLHLTLSGTKVSSEMFGKLRAAGHKVRESVLTTFR